MAAPRRGRRRGVTPFSKQSAVINGQIAHGVFKGRALDVKNTLDETMKIVSQLHNIAPQKNMQHF